MRTKARSLNEGDLEVHIDTLRQLGVCMMQLIGSDRAVVARAGQVGPPPLTTFSTFITRNIGKAPYSRQIRSCLTEFLQVGPNFRQVSLTRNESQNSQP